MSKSFQKIVEEVKENHPLKKVEDDTPLPFIFDTLIDAKFGKDIENLKNDTMIRRLLAENGFDVEEWLQRRYNV